MKRFIGYGIPVLQILVIVAFIVNMVNVVPLKADVVRHDGEIDKLTECVSQLTIMSRVMQNEDEHLNGDIGAMVEDIKAIRVLIEDLRK